MANARKTVDATDTFETIAMIKPEAMKEGYEKLAKSMSTFADFQKHSIEAMMASATALAKGFERAASEQSAFAKEAFEESVAAAKAATTSKSVQEAMEIQSDFARTAFEKQLGHATKLADHWNTVAKEAADPITKRYSDLVELVQSYRP